MILTKIKRIYFLAICGTAMASLAAMFKSKGYEVYGSDENVYPPMSTFLAEQGIPVFEGFDPAHLEPAPDLVVIGNVMSRGNPEVEAILSRRLRYTSLPQALKEFFIRGRRSIVVAGTHGKTTTSALLAWTLQCAGRDPGFLIGGLVENFSRGFQVGTGEDFITEGDEYDTAFFDKGPKFLHYLPDVVILNSIEFDHADIYNSLEEIKVQFRRLINIIPGNGLLLACDDDANVNEMLPQAFCPVETFGISQSNNWRAENIRTSEQGTSFEVFRDNHSIGLYSLPLFGTHNVKNALAVIGTAARLGIDVSTVQKAFTQFKGIRKRLQLKGEAKGIRIYDDFAHHPTAVRETLNGLRARYQKNKIWAVYEPRSAATRRSVFQKEFSNAFDAADWVVVAPVHRIDKAPADDRFSVSQLVSDLRTKNIKAFHFNSVEKIVQYINAEAAEGDIIVTLSNGDFDGIHQKLLDALLGIEIKENYYGTEKTTATTTR